MTHEVTNQPPPLAGTNAWRGDPLLVQLAETFSAEVRKDLDLHGRFVMSHEAQDLARLANTETPKLRSHDRQGRRLDQVEYHPAYHALLRRSVQIGLHSSVWENGEAETARRHQVRAARFFLTAQLECGHLCPITMTSASLAALMASPKLFREWAPRVTTRKYDQSQKPPVEKTGLTLGMGMTEKQGGTDVRANTTRAERAGNGFYRLTGHKWFMSAPMSDAFLVLGQANEGLSCFLVPRILSDGTGNGFRFQRLKDKLGNRSNASSEVEFDGAWARMVGREGRGVPTIIEMVNHTRLDCVIGAAAGMRQGVAQATHHAQHRSAFGKRLIEQPLMQNVLADLCVESEAATAAMMRLARAYDARGEEGEGLFARLATAVIKYWVCKRWPAHAAEALECLGGSGYVEEAPLARLYRESPLNGIWEGSGNVICLDVLRAMAKGPEVVDAFFAEVDRSRGADPRLDQFVLTLRDDLDDAENIEARARDLVERMAVALQGALLVRDGDPAVAEAFCASRLAGQHRLAFGTLPPGFHFTRIIERARPE